VLGLSVRNIKLLFCLPPTKFIVGIVYHAVNVISTKNVAIKLEPIDTENPQLQYEHSIYKSLAGVIGIPSVRWFGTEGDYNAMVLELLGPSLEELFNRSNHKFSLKTILILADQMVGAGHSDVMYDSAECQNRTDLTY
jgi:serine/threonine protein kinase